MEQRYYLAFYVRESQRHHGKLIYEWLLETSREMGLAGGSAFRALAGFGRHRTLHEEHFFELAGDVPVEVSFVVSEQEANILIAHLGAEKLSLPYMKMPAQFGVTGEQ
ncbi:MAG: DUF190 domain-containing protein [Betaproteobacteria bacterium]|nr:DUF190 domain-containing protein [Betaproteobacteria bacterium]